MLSMRIKTQTVLLAILISCTPLLGNSAPTIEAMPVVSSESIIADDLTQCTVTLVASDADGYDNLLDMRVMFNFTESGMDTAEARGYVSWAQNDGAITNWGGTWTLADAGGDGGRWGINTDWGGGLYARFLDCTMTVSGNATGGSGTRTVVWAFVAQPAWGENPLMNDVDVFVRDFSVNVGWLDGDTFFDVVSQPCTIFANTPSPVLLSNVTSTTVDVSINPADSGTDRYTILVSRPLGGNAFVQADGMLDVSTPVWQTRAEWSTTTVVGLAWATTYGVSVRAMSATAGVCPSPFGPVTEVATSAEAPLIDTDSGTLFNPGVRGQNPYRSTTVSAGEGIWDLGIGSSGRGLAGGLDADTYDWCDINSGSNWGNGRAQWTTLEFLSFARDHNAWPLLTANLFGGGYRCVTQDPGSCAATHPEWGDAFVCETDNPDQLAADWVRYTNFILPSYRQGDVLTASDQAIVDAIVDWAGRDTLLPAGEANTPRVEYWEIGNEPELGGYGDFLQQHHLNPTDYRDRYRLITDAMLTVDPAIKVGPCLMMPENENSGSSGDYVVKLLTANPPVQVDFVSFHPYYTAIKWAWGSPIRMADGLREYKGVQRDRLDGIRGILTQYGHPDCELIASEWNPVSWDAASYIQSSQATALGVVESAFIFAEEGFAGAHFWEWPTSKKGPNDAFEGLRDHMGDVLVTTSEEMGLSPDAANFRLYVTRDSNDADTIRIWGVNFDDTESVTLNLGFSSPICITGGTIHRYGIPGGDTSLMDNTGMAWMQETVTEPLNVFSFPITLEDAELTVMVLNIVRVSTADFDRDGDVDHADFGYLQRCFSGPSVDQTDPACANAKLDGDADVDQDDFGIFQGCISGPNIPADPNCAD